MRPRLLAVFILGLICLVATQARAESEIVVAIRYLQAEGTSHAHLYLYSEDGKLLRQLTNDNSGQDVEPIFTSDGAKIVFTREKPNNIRETWTIDPSGKAAKKLEAAPDWYTATKSSPYFTIKPEQSTSAMPTLSPGPTPVPAYKSPDNSDELVLREDAKDEDDQINGPGHGKHYLLRDLKTGAETEFRKLPGFYGVSRLLHENQDEDQHFLFDGPLRLAFFDLHLNSTDGGTVFALDFTGPRLVRLSPNWATPIPLPGEAAFLTFTENRYVPIPGSKKTANCSYMERWNEKLDKVHYAHEKSAAVCYGASCIERAARPQSLRCAKPRITRIGRTRDFVFAFLNSRSSQHSAHAQSIHLAGSYFSCVAESRLLANTGHGSANGISGQAR